MAGKMTVEHIRRLKEELQKVQMSIRTLQGQEQALQLAISVVSDEVGASTGKSVIAATETKRRSPIKDIVLRYAIQNAEQGVVAADIVQLAAAEGQTLDRNSVSSLLSKFKKEGVLDHDGKVYRPAPRPAVTLKEVA